MLKMLYAEEVKNYVEVIDVDSDDEKGKDD